MKKTLYLILFSTITTSLSVRVAENLAPLRPSNICSINASIANIDDKEDLKLEDLLRKEIDNRNILYGRPFGIKDERNCAVNLILSLKAFKSDSGSYVYSMSYQVIPDSLDVAGLLSSSRGGSEMDALLKYVVIWDTAFYGIAPNYSKLSEVAVTGTGKMFDEFLLDWRNTH